MPEQIISCNITQTIKMKQKTIVWTRRLACNHLLYHRYQPQT